MEQGREVFSILRIAQSKCGKGTNKLIKQGAKLIEDAEVVLREIRPLVRGRSTPFPLCVESRGNIFCTLS